METEKEYRQSVESGRERRFDSKAGEQIFESHYIDGKKEGEEWEIFEDGRTLLAFWKTCKKESKG